MVNVNKMLIEKELKKELIRRDFYEFCVYMDPKFFTDGKPHLKKIANALQSVFENKIKKLAISLPPRAGKSYIISLFCAWVFGNENDSSIMRNSYAAKLAEKFSKDIRDGFIIGSDKYREIFPNVRINSNNAAVDGWSLNSNSQVNYFCAGVGGPITGFGCNRLAILDDPIKNIEEALSETVVESIWNWYTSTHLSRLENDCANIHIATRWTKKDPIGRLTDPYSQFYDPEFVVINISALDENGKTFCEEIKTTAQYHDIRKVTEDFIWEAEFMQRPVESKGLLFPINELKRFRMSEIKTKKADAVIGFTDTADKGSDFLSSPIGEKHRADTYITNVVFTQDGVEITEPLVARQIIDTKCEIMTIETNNGGGAFARNVRDLVSNRSHCTINLITTTQNKETRILMSAGYIKEHFYFREDYEPGSDYDKFMRQLTSYMKMGKNKHDDAADSLTGLAEYCKNLPIYEEEKPKNKEFDPFMREYEDEGDVYMKWY